MKIKQISPLEHNFTKRLDGIAVMPKMLYYYGELPENTSIGSSIDSYGRIARPHEDTLLEKDQKSDSGVVKTVFTELGPDDSLAGPVMSQDWAFGLPLKRDIRIKSVAIVGARKNTPYGEDVAFRAAYELAKRGVVIVSGLAYGIDSIAHRGALAAGGVTVGVLGTSIDKIYPARHIGLAKEMIEKGGAVISEYAPGTKMHAWRFLERNRIISGLSDAVIVVEANIKSGSLNTAIHALEQGRELFAVPGDINRPLSQGCNRLIVQGANPYTCVEDVLNFLFPEAEKKNRTQANLFGDNKEETVLLQALARGIQNGEEILRETGMGVAKYNQTVTMLEIKGRIRSLGMNRWTLA